MTLLGLVLLAALWLAVLAPTLRRKQAEFKPLDSIGDFRSNLQALARRIPVVVPPANRMRPRPPWSPGFVEPAELGLMPRRRSSARHPGRPQPLGTRTSTSRRHALRRRRQVLSALLALLVASLAVGALPNPHFRVLWAASAGVALLVGAYLGLLVHLRRATTGHADRRVPAERQLDPPIAEDDLPTAELELDLPSPPEATGLLDRSVGS